jgi:Flp pilus assembly pilin Flp
MRNKIRFTVIAAMIAVMMLPTFAVSARAGGSHIGGFGGGHIGTHTFGGGGTRFYGGRHFFFFPFFGRRTSIIWLIIIAVALIAALYNWLQKKRVERAQPHDTVPMTAELADEFSKLFLRVEDDWSRNDQDDLARVFDPGYMRQQRILLNSYARKNSYNRLTDVAIVNMEEELTGDPNRVHVAVTAQMRDFFEYTDKDERYNAKLRDDAEIQRFTEVWEMHRDEAGNLIVDTIRQV